MGQSQDLLLKVVEEQSRRGWASCSRIQMPVCQEEQRRDVGCEETAGSLHIWARTQHPHQSVGVKHPHHEKQENTQLPQLHCIVNNPTGTRHRVDMTMLFKTMLKQGEEDVNC